MSLNATEKKAAGSLPGKLKADPSLWADPAMTELKAYIISLGATLPAAATPAPEPTPPPAAGPKAKTSNKKADEEDFSDLPELEELRSTEVPPPPEDDDELMKPEEGPPQEMGPAVAPDELTDAQQAAVATAKEAAQDCLESGDHVGAAKHLTVAIKVAPSALSYAKRAQCYLAAKKPVAAVRDCDAALALNPDSARALLLRGTAKRHLGRYAEAVKDLDTGLAIDFDDKAAAMAKMLHEKIAKAKAAKGGAKPKATPAPSTGGGFGGGIGGGMGRGGGGGMPPGMQAAMADPEIQALMQDPAVMQKLMAVQSNPALLTQYMSDPAFTKLFTKLTGSMGGGGGGGRSGVDDFD